MGEHRPRRPHGSWPSPITAARLVEGSAAVGEVRVDGDDVWWREARASEGGRSQLVRCTPQGNRHDLFTSPDWNARTQVHEYGGGAWAVRDGVVVFANWADQRLYRVDGGEEPVAITPEPSVPRGLRWADVTLLADGWLVAVRESHEPDAVEAHGEAINEVVALPVDGAAVADPSLVRVLVTGPDFVAAPAVSADGQHLAWIEWDHPNMPWDGTRLRRAVVRRDGDARPAGLEAVEEVAGGPDVSIVQPQWTASGELAYLSDETGWWNPWKVGADRENVLLGAAEGEMGGPAWVFGGRWATVRPDGSVVGSFTQDGLTGLGFVAADGDGTIQALPSAFTAVEQVVAADGDDAVIVAATPQSDLAPYRVGLDEEGNPAFSLLRPHPPLGIDPEWFSAPHPIEFESAGGRTAHALYYEPTNPEVQPPDGEQPPLLVLSHGGPTAAARAKLDLAKQFWTSRGFAVVDVNYGGSVGYGRPYRKLLDGTWGIVDVEDCIAAARHLVDEGLADPDRIAIRGGSAGGYTTLAALTFHDDFAAGASHYGVADLEALARDTHKFESRYLDGLIGPYPEAKATYEARSPINHTEGLSAPLIVLQGLEDEVVPPNQAEMMIEALAAKGIPHAYLAFEGEQHGFRQAPNIIRALEAELWFYGKVFGFEPADDIEPVAGAIGLDG